MSLISCLIITSLISFHSSHVSISCHSSHVSISCHSSYVTHLMSHHYLTNLMSQHYVNDTKLLPIYSQVATLNFCPWLLPISYRIILPVTSAHFLRSNLSPTRSVLLPRRIGIVFQGVSHSSQSRSHVTHFISRSHVNLITCHSSHLSSLRQSSHVSSLSHSSHVSSLRLYTLGWPYLTSTHFLCPLVTAWYYRWPLPIPSAVPRPLRSNLCPPRSVPLLRRIGIGFEAVSHSSQSRSHVTYLMSHHYVTQPDLKG